MKIKRNFYQGYASLTQLVIVMTVMVILIAGSFSSSEFLNKDFTSKDQIRNDLSIARLIATSTHSNVIVKIEDVRVRYCWVAECDPQKNQAVTTDDGIPMMTLVNPASRLTPITFTFLSSGRLSGDSDINITEKSQVKPLLVLEAFTGLPRQEAP